MSAIRKRFAAGVLLIGATYFYFLIFAQFAFLELARRVDSSESRIQQVMGAMAAGGLIGSFIVPLLGHQKQRHALRIAYLGSAVVGIAAASASGHFELLGLFIGLFVGIVTVGVATMLPFLFVRKNWTWGTALGTGLAYFLCNVPLVFNASAAWQSVAASVIMLVAIGAVPMGERGSVTAQAENRSHYPRAASERGALAYFILFFGILIWLDSAVFFTIQHSALKEGTWGSDVALWRNAVIHLCAAFLVALFIRRFGFPALLTSAFVLLALGSMAVNHPELQLLTGWSYPAGVSIYSACLVAFPGFGPSSKGRSQIAWIAATLYAVSGWMGSGLGIGMAQNLHRVPISFIAVAATIIAVPSVWSAVWKSRLEISYTAAVVAAAGLIHLVLRPAVAVDLSDIAKGRAVYIAEGCINCHSQFVRPRTGDEMVWGPHRAIERLASDPPLYGNRRQGPDLLNVGNRRSRAWLELHFKVPRALARGSSMPAYEHLFRDDRGAALVDYLSALKGEEPRNSAMWRPDHEAQAPADAAVLYREHCAVCHRSAGKGPHGLPIVFRKDPPDLFSTNLIYAPATLPAPVRVEQIAQIIKYGISGTDMAGHEYLSNQEIVALAQFLEQESALK